MSLVIAHLDSFPEPQDGEATVALSMTMAQPQKLGDAEGWRARATCTETERVIGRWMSDCPLSAAQSALLWLGMHPWEVVPDEVEGGWDYAMILEKAERPVPDVLHVRDMLDRIATNLPPKRAGATNAVTGARVRLALPPPSVEDEGEDEGDEDGDGDADGDGMDEADQAAEAAAIAADQVERRRLLKKAILLAQRGRGVQGLAAQLEKRMDADLAETFLTAMAAIQPPEKPPAQAGKVSAEVAPSATVARPAAVPAKPAAVKPAAARLAAAQAAEAALAGAQAQAQAEAELAQYAADDPATRAKLERTQQRAARERAKVANFLAQRAQREAVQAEAQAARQEVLEAEAAVQAEAVAAAAAGPSEPVETVAAPVGPVAGAAPSRRPRKPKAKADSPSLVLLSDLRQA